MDKHLGNLIGYYGLSKVLKVVLLLPVFVCWLAMIGLIVAWVIFKTDAAGILSLALVLAMMGFMALWWSMWIIRHYSQVWLYDYGFVVQNKYDKQKVSFNQINYIYDYTNPVSGVSDGFTFCTENGDKWIRIYCLLTNYHELRDLFYERYIEQRSAVLLKQLHQGKTVILHKLSDQQSRLKSLFCSKISTKDQFAEIKLNKNNLIIDNHCFNLAIVGGVERDRLAERLKIIDCQGKTLYSTHIAAILSAGLLAALVTVLHQALLSEGAV